MVRRIDERSERLNKMGAEVVQGDLTNLADIQRVMQGCSRVFFGMSVSPSYLEATVNVAAVAKHLGVKCLVNISQMTVSEMDISNTTPSPQHKLHWLAEQVLNWSGLPVVHVRPTIFLDNPFFTQLAANAIRTANELKLPFGTGRTSPISTDDVANVIATILLSPAPHIGKIYNLTGPLSQDGNGIASEYSAALGRQVKYVNVSLDEWVKLLKSLNLPQHVQDHIHTMADLHRQNRYDRYTDTVEKITGTKPKTITTWVRENIEQFQAPEERRTSLHENLPVFSPVEPNSRSN